MVSIDHKAVVGSPNGVIVRQAPLEKTLPHKWLLCDMPKVCGPPVEFEISNRRQTDEGARSLGELCRLCVPLKIRVATPDSFFSRLC